MHPHYVGFHFTYSTAFKLASSSLSACSLYNSHSSSLKNITPFVPSVQTLHIPPQPGPHLLLSPRLPSYTSPLWPLARATSALSPGPSFVPLAISFLRVPGLFPPRFPSRIPLGRPMYNSTFHRLLLQPPNLCFPLSMKTLHRK